MIYLDYAAHMPAREEVLAAYCSAVRAETANPNARYPAGEAARARYGAAMAEIRALLGAEDFEPILTASATEANNLAIKGAARQRKVFGRHIVTTRLEHSSVLGAVESLADDGWQVDFAEPGRDGHIDPGDLRALLRDDTVLLSVCLVESETGARQDISALAEIVRAKPRCLLHIDATQAVGREIVPLDGVGLLTFAPHKFGGLPGSGVLLRRPDVILEPLIHGGMSATQFRSGTPDTPQAVAAAAALRLALSGREAAFAHTRALRDFLRAELTKRPAVRINSPADGAPHILNFSLPGVDTNRLQRMLGERGICVSTKSACCAPGAPSKPVFALTGDRRLALSTLRVSLSAATAQGELDAFLAVLDEVLTALSKR